MAEGSDEPVGFCLVEYSATGLRCRSRVGVEGGTPFDAVQLRRVIGEVAGYDRALSG